MPRLQTNITNLLHYFYSKNKLENMVVPIIVGIALLLIVIYIALKILKNIIIGIILIVLVLLAAFFIFGYIPNLRAIPIIGGLLPSLPTNPGEVLVSIRNMIYNVEVLGANRDSQNNLLIAIANSGKLDVSEIRIFVDNQIVNITNSPKDPLKSGEVTIIQTNWNKNLTEIQVQTKQVNATHVPK